MANEGSQRIELATAVIPIEVDSTKAEQAIEDLRKRIADDIGGAVKDATVALGDIRSSQSTESASGRDRESQTLQTALLATMSADIGEIASLLRQLVQNQFGEGEVR